MTEMDSIEESPRSEPALRAIAMPADANPRGDIFGGWPLSQMDLADSMVAIRRARTRVARVAVTSMTFRKIDLRGASPVQEGEKLDSIARRASPDVPDRSRLSRASGEAALAAGPILVSALAPVTCASSPGVLAERRGRSWVLEEEAHHLATGVGPVGLGVRSLSAPAGPCVAGSVKDPLLQHRSPAFVRLNGAGVLYPAQSLAAADGSPEIRSSLRLGNDLIAVDGVDGRVAVTVEHDGRNSAHVPAVPA
jgi:hypothetical protein